VLVRWVTWNVCLFVGLEVAYGALLTAIVRAPLGIGVTIVVLGAFLTSPMLPIYLAIIARLPKRWTDRRRRVAAIAASPLLLTLFAIVLGAFVGGVGLFLFVVAVPGPLIFGSLVRLPGHTATADVTTRKRRRRSAGAGVRE
jgi:hypothetical protein